MKLFAFLLTKFKLFDLNLFFLFKTLWRRIGGTLFKSSETNIS